MSEVDAPPSPQDLLLQGDMEGFIKSTLGDAEEPQEEESAKTPEPPAAEAEPHIEVPAPEPVKTSWKDAVIPNDDPDAPEFFKGKRVLDLATAELNATRKIKEQAETLKKLEAQLAAREALEDVAKHIQGKQEPAPQAPADPFAELNLSEDIVLHPEKVTQALLQKAEQIAEQKINGALTQRDQLRAAQQVIGAIEQARVALDIAPEDFAHDGYVLMEVAKQVDPRLATDPRFYVQYLRDRTNRLAPVYGRYGAPARDAAPAAPTPQSPPPPAPAAAANPPGAKRAAPPPAAPTEGTTTLTATQRGAMNEALDALGTRLDPEARKLFEQNYVARVTRRRGE